MVFFSNSNKKLKVLVLQNISAISSKAVGRKEPDKAVLLIKQAFTR